MIGMDYTNSPLASLTKLSTMHSGQRQFPISRITPHIYVGQVSIRDMGNFFASPDHQVSCNYCISKDGEIGLIVEEKNRSWCTNSPDNDGKGITIECASDRTQPYALLPSVYETLIRLCTDICQRNGKKKLLWISDKTKALSYLLAKDEMLLTVHMWFRDTDCPGQWLMNHMGELASKVTAALQDSNDEESALKPVVEESINAPIEQTVDLPVSNGIQGKDLAKMSIDNVIKLLGPIFTEEQKRTGLLASVMIAQFITECGGNSELLQKANNGFGMKAMISGNTWSDSVWNGTSVYKMQTKEWNADGTPFTITEVFRAYDCVESSIRDHSQYLLGAMNGEQLRYKGLSGCIRARDAAEIIYNGGYCTSPDYVDALLYYIELYDLDLYNCIPEEPCKDDEYIMVKKSDWNALKASYAANVEIFRKYEE